MSSKLIMYCGLDHMARRPPLIEQQTNSEVDAGAALHSSKCFANDGEANPAILSVC
jgi:hypothetical protein